jgi:glycosyltransferase involved in cell wall biosynthesis
MKKLSIICPVYNESESVAHSATEVVQVLSALDLNYEIIFVDDGSKDETKSVIRKVKDQYPFVRLIALSRNFGKEAALTAGLNYCDGDAAIPIDVDMQDPPELIPKMVEQWLAGFDCVLAKRINRDMDTYFKRCTSSLFYRLHNKIASLEIPENVGDFRLIDRKVIDVLSQCEERERFMKGLFSWAGFSCTEIHYERANRKHGDSKFNFIRLWQLALNGITGFSTIPLKIWTYIGLFFACFSFVYLGIVVTTTLIRGIDMPGYASLISTVLFLGGIQLIGIGVLGEYIGRIYMEVKKRPIYIVESEE